MLKTKKPAQPGRSAKRRKGVQSVRVPKRLPVLPTQHPQCAQCLPAKCCRYFSLEMDRPRSKRDYDDFLWMLAHGHVSIYVEGSKWFLMIHTQCEFLDTETNLCKIYDTRPQMCREHSVEECEWHGPYEFDHHFKSYDELMSWLKRKKLR